MRLAQNNNYAEKNFTASNTRCSNANSKTTPRLLIFLHKLMIIDLNKREKKADLGHLQTNDFCEKSKKMTLKYFYSFSFEKVLCTLKKKLRVYLHSFKSYTHLNFLYRIDPVTSSWQRF